MSGICFKIFQEREGEGEGGKVGRKKEKRQKGSYLKQIWQNFVEA